MCLDVLISIIIPVYNTGIYLLHALESVKQQSYKNIELILVDDGSTDDSVVIAKKFLKSVDFKWRIICTENKGVSNARNVGIEECNGEWILCLDSDDFIVPDTIMALYKVVIKNNSLCAFCEYKSVNIQSIESAPTHDDGIVLFTKDELKREFLNRSIKFVIPATLIHYSVAEKIKFDVDCPYSEDTLYTWELIYQVENAVYLKSDMYNYFIREGSKQHSQTKEKCLKSIECYHLMVTRLLKQTPSDKEFIGYIMPKFILSAFHVLARCIPYNVFLEARSHITKSSILPLMRSGDFRLTVYALSFLFVPRIYYRISQ